jgi:hypothetical protein
MPTYRGLGISDKEAYEAIKDWVKRGCPAARTELTYRYQATYPLTFCHFWVKPDLRMWYVGRTKWDDRWVAVTDYVAVDAHYDKINGTFQAIGGLWVDELKDFSIKPQQEWNERARYGQLLDLCDRLRRLFPNTAPDKLTLRHYQTIRDYLKA